MLKGVLAAPSPTVDRAGWLVAQPPRAATAGGRLYREPRERAERQDRYGATADGFLRGSQDRHPDASCPWGARRVFHRAGDSWGDATRRYLLTIAGMAGRVRRPTDVEARILEIAVGVGSDPEVGPGGPWFYTYAMAEKVAEAAEGQTRRNLIKNGSLYRSVSAMTRKGWLERQREPDEERGTHPGKPKTYYRITSAGQAALLEKRLSDQGADGFAATLAGRLAAGLAQAAGTGPPPADP